MSRNTSADETYRHCDHCGQWHHVYDACQRLSFPFGNPNDALLTPEHHLTASEQMGAKLCQLFGLDPSRFSASYLRGAAQAAAGILGKHYAGPGFDAAKWALIKAEHRHASPCADLDVFLRATREVA